MTKLSQNLMALREYTYIISVGVGQETRKDELSPLLWGLFTRLKSRVSPICKGSAEESTSKLNGMVVGKA